MEHDPKRKPSQSVEVIPTFANIQPLRTDPSATCPLAGRSMDFPRATSPYLSESPRLRFRDRKIVAGATDAADASPERASLVDLHTDSVAFREC
jgi:hypothetical protein